MLFRIICHGVCAIACAVAGWFQPVVFFPGGIGIADQAELLGSIQEFSRRQNRHKSCRRSFTQPRRYVLVAANEKNILRLKRSIGADQLCYSSITGTTHFVCWVQLLLCQLISIKQLFVATHHAPHVGSESDIMGKWLLWPHAPPYPAARPAPGAAANQAAGYTVS